MSSCNLETVGCDTQTYALYILKVIIDILVINVIAFYVTTRTLSNQQLSVFILVI